MDYQVAIYSAIISGDYANRLPDFVRDMSDWLRSTADSRTGIDTHLTLDTFRIGAQGRVLLGNH